MVCIYKFGSNNLKNFSSCRADEAAAEEIEQCWSSVFDTILTEYTPLVCRWFPLQSMVQWFFLGTFDTVDSWKKSGEFSHLVNNREKLLPTSTGAGRIPSIKSMFHWFWILLDFLWTCWTCDIHGLQNLGISQDAGVLNYIQAFNNYDLQHAMQPRGDVARSTGWTFQLISFYIPTMKMKKTPPPTTTTTNHTDDDT